LKGACGYDEGQHEENAMLMLAGLLDDAKCYEVVRQMRWPEGVKCPHCGAATVSKQGRDARQPERQDYRCTGCMRYFDDLSETIFAGRHQPLQVWIGCLYLMGLNQSNRQIAHELGLAEADAQRMTEQLRKGIVAVQSETVLSGKVEFDEAYVVAGHKGQPQELKKKDGPRVGGDSRARRAARRLRERSLPCSG
jgi:transposase-like protein